MDRSTTSLSDTARCLLAALAGLLFSIACLAAALGPVSAACERLHALDCPTRL